MSINSLPSPILYDIYQYISFNGDQKAFCLISKYYQTFGKNIIEPIAQQILQEASLRHTSLDEYIKRIAPAPSSNFAQYDNFLKRVGIRVQFLAGLLSVEDSVKGMISTAQVQAISDFVKKEENDNLEKVSGDIQGAICGTNPNIHFKYNIGAEAFRTWLRNNPLPLASVETLFLSNPNLQMLIPEIGLFTGLHHLYLSGSPLLFLPDQVGELIDLETLNLSETGFKELPKSGKLTCLKTLYLSRNNLTTLSPHIGDFIHLSFLDLKENRLKWLPDSMTKLVRLKKLHLDYNLMETFPKVIAGLTSLICLELYLNRFSSIPEEVGQLTQLEYLGLGANNLSYLASCLTKCISLASLDISDNKDIAFLPPEIGSLPRLTSININHTAIKSLPKEFDLNRIRVINDAD